MEGIIGTNLSREKEQRTSGKVVWAMKRSQIISDEDFHNVVELMSISAGLVKQMCLWSFGFFSLEIQAHKHFLSALEKNCLFTLSLLCLYQITVVSSLRQ